MIAARKVPEVEYYRAYALGFGILGDEFMRAVDDLGFQSPFCEQFIRAVDSILLYIEGDNPAAFADKPAQECGIIAPACGCVDACIAFFYGGRNYTVDKC